MHVIDERVKSEWMVDAEEARFDLYVSHFVEIH